MLMLWNSFIRCSLNSHFSAWKFNYFALRWDHIHTSPGYNSRLQLNVDICSSVSTSAESRGGGGGGGGGGGSCARTARGKPNLHMPRKDRCSARLDQDTPTEPPPFASCRNGRNHIASIKWSQLINNADSAYLAAMYNVLVWTRLPRLLASFVA